MSDRRNGDYPGQVFFGVHKGRKQCIEPTYQQLLANIQDYPSAVYEAFMNKVHASEFSKTGKIPSGAVPVKPGMSRTSGAPPGPIAGPSAPSKLVNVSGKAKAVSLNAAVESRPTMSFALGGAGSSGQLAAGTRGPGSKSTVSSSGVKPSGEKIATLIRGTPTPVGGNKSTSINTVRNASTSAVNTGRVEVWTDGSCLGNGKDNAVAAYAVYFGPGDSRNEAARAPGNQTNNVGEIYAVIRALEIVDESVKHLIIYTDSKYTIESLGWLPGWKKRGGMNSSNKPAKNYSMIKYMDALMTRRGDRVELVHVRGHQDNAGNNAADLMARTAANDPHVPPTRDWDLECVKVQKMPLVSVTGSPKITAVDSPLVKTEPRDDDSDYGYSDIDLDDADIEHIDPPLNRYASDDTRATSLSNDEKPAVGKKRAREEPAQEEVQDSDAEPKAARKKAKEQAIKCPSCKHTFNITLRK
ncbi:unnamed protein product [Rhizoctonia solani]|uniref:ribonuclease H n=1 Tax=Rhizoctonia solani TaxID=456999 RepID=A0A8H3AE19_9AGAM|nr:unnamed protein product [Rhizoctonia solani]